MGGNHSIGEATCKRNLHQKNFSGGESCPKLDRVFRDTPIYIFWKKSIYVVYNIYSNRNSYDRGFISVSRRSWDDPMKYTQETHERFRRQCTWKRESSHSLSHLNERVAKPVAWYVIYIYWNRNSDDRGYLGFTKRMSEMTPYSSRNYLQL